MLDLALRLISNTLSLGIFIYYINHCLKFKSIKIRNILILLFLFLMKTRVLDFNIPILNLFITFLFNVYILTLAHGTIIKKFWLFIVFISLSILSEEAGLFLHEIFLFSILPVDISIFITTLLAKAFLLIFANILILLFKVIEYENIQYQHVVILMTFPVSTIVLLISIRYPVYVNKQNILLLCSILMLLVANIGCFYEYYMLAKSRRVKIENEILMAQLKDNEKYIALHKRKMEKDSSFIHDEKKHITYLKCLIEQDKKDEALKYIVKHMYDIETKRDIITGNESFDIVLSLYMNKIIDNHITIDYLGIQKVNLNWIDPKDLNTIFSNLIENAIEGTILSDNPKIIFSLKEFDTKIIFRLSNTCNLKILEGNNGKSSKPDPDSHGYGLKNVKSCVDRNGAIMTEEINKPTSCYITTILFQKPI